jgi:hypothetical protein
MPSVHEVNAPLRQSSKVDLLSNRGVHMIDTITTRIINAFVHHCELAKDLSRKMVSRPLECRHLGDLGSLLGFQQGAWKHGRSGRLSAWVHTEVADFGRYNKGSCNGLQRSARAWSGGSQITAPDQCGTAQEPPVSRFGSHSTYRP